MPKDIDVLCFGELLWDIFPDREVLGGAPANVAFRLQELGTSVLLASRVGQDEFSSRAQELLEERGVSTALLQTDSARPTGTVEVFLSSTGSADYNIRPGVAYDAIEYTEPLAEVSKKARVICFGSVVQRADISQRTLYRLLAERNGKAFFDMNLRKNCFHEKMLDDSLQRTDILKLNDEELYQVKQMFSLGESEIPALAAELQKRWDIDIILVTQAERGVFALSKSETIKLPGNSVAVKDTVGSGDAFSAGFLHQHLLGQSLAEACRFGNALGAWVATTAGATEPLDETAFHDFLGGIPATTSR